MTTPTADAGNPGRPGPARRPEPDADDAPTDHDVPRFRDSRISRVVDGLISRPTSSWPLAIARVVLGIGILGWAVSMMFEVSTFLGGGSLGGGETGGWRVFRLSTESGVWVALVVLTIAALAVIVGWKPTPFLLVAFVLLVAIQRRNPLILNSGDIILRDLTLLLALTPSGAALSLDRWRTHGRAAMRTAPLVAPWGLRLVQLQVMVVYLFAFWGKSGALWQEGTAVSTAFRLRDLQRFGQLDVLVDNVTVVALLTWGTLIAEALLGTMLWNTRLRPALIVLGVLLHLLIDTFVLVGFFGIAMIAGLMTFLDGERITRRLARPTPP